MARYKGPARRSKRELDEIATQIVQGQVYYAPVWTREFHDSFGWLFWLMDPPMSKKAAKTIGGAYEEFSKAMPRAINGVPMFSSGRILHIDDTRELFKAIVRKEEALHGPVTYGVYEDGSLLPLYSGKPLDPYVHGEPVRVYQRLHAAEKCANWIHADA